MKSAKGSRRRRSDAIQRELRSLRDDVQAPVETRSHDEPSSALLSHRIRYHDEETARGTAGHEDGRRGSVDIGRNHLIREGHGAYMAGAGLTSDDSYEGAEVEEKAPFSGSPRMSASARVSLAERALAEMTAQRDEALDLLEVSRRENARLSAELERSRSYKALYAAAHEEHKGMKASLAASTQICMGQQKLIQMLQASSMPSSALDPEELFAGPGGNVPLPPPSPPPPQHRQKRGVIGDAGEDKAEASAAAAIALVAQGNAGVDDGGGIQDVGRGADEAYRSLKARGVARDKGGFYVETSAAEAAAIAAEAGATDFYKPYVKSQALYPEQTDAADVEARQAIAMRAAASVARKSAMREGLTAASMAGGSSGRGGDGGGNRAGARGGGPASGAGRLHLLDDDLISHSSLRRELDDTFLNQPLRGEARRGSYGAAVESGVMDGGSGDISGADGGGPVAGHVRTRASRGHIRERTRTKSGSQSSVSTVASTSKSTKALGTKEEPRSRKSKADRPSRERATRGSSPRPSAPRQARAAQRLSSGTSASVGSSGGGPSGGTSGAAGGAADTRDRRGSAGSSTRLSSRGKR